MDERLLLKQCHSRYQSHLEKDNALIQRVDTGELPNRLDNIYAHCFRFTVKSKDASTELVPQQRRKILLAIQSCEPHSRWRNLRNSLPGVQFLRVTCISPKSLSSEQLPLFLSDGAVSCSLLLSKRFWEDFPLLLMICSFCYSGQDFLSFPLCLRLSPAPCCYPKDPGKTSFFFQWSLHSGYSGQDLL